jgi:hypothetical protein
MSFFVEVIDGDAAPSQVVLFSTHTDNEPYKRYLSGLGGTFCRELESKRGTKCAAWVFDMSKKLEVEAFVLENEDKESVESLPDVEQIFDEIFRRLESLEKTVEALRASE